MWLACALAAAAGTLADLPDPLTGSDSGFELSHGGTYPAVFLPFAMCNWTAENGAGGWPYQYRNDRIFGFRATHRPSPWMVDYGPISFLPETGELKLAPGERGSRFRHADEESRAYRYRVFLQDYRITAEVAPARHGGILRFTFPRTDRAYVIADADELHIDRDRITGESRRTSRGTAENFAVYYVAAFDHPFAESGMQDGHAWVRFATGEDERVTVRVGTSLISLEQAQRNLDHEIPRADFDAVAARAREEWDRELGRIDVRGGALEQRRTFYTALYHALQFPRMLAESDASGGQVHYSPYDGKIHAGPLLSDTDLWATHRAEFPLLALLQPKRDAEMIRAMLNAYAESGRIPKWPNPGETDVGIGAPAGCVIADAYLKGIHDFDAEKAYAAIRSDGEARKVPAQGSVSWTLGNAFDDACVAHIARALGKAGDDSQFLRRSKAYRGVMQMPADPLAWGGAYIDGNAWQWMWSAQQDVPGLVALLGGREAFIARLDELFTMTSDYHVGAYRQVTHRMREAKLANMGQYAHMDEQMNHVPYMYDYVGQPWKTQQRVREIMDRLYRTGPDGLPGDDDTGALSAWYIFSALGFYPVNPSQPVYALGSPLFDRAAIHLENGGTFVVMASRAHASDAYIQSATLDGKPLQRPWITHAEITRGGTLSFRLGPTPNRAWGASAMPDPEDRLARDLTDGIPAPARPAYVAKAR